MFLKSRRNKLKKGKESKKIKRRKKDLDKNQSNIIGINLMLLWKHQYPMNLKKFFLSPIFPNSKKNYQDTKNYLNSSMSKNKL